MSYAIIARCRRSGELGLAAASHTMAIGLYADAAVRPRAGATFTLGRPEPRNNRLVNHLLAMGMTPSHVMREIEGNDPAIDERQVGLVDREGNVALHSGARLAPWAGHRAGADHAVMGEGIAGERVLEAMSAAFAAAPAEDLDERLLRALEAGRDAGGLAGPAGRLPERSSVLVVWGVRDVSEMDLRVDLHPRSVDDLRRIYDDYKPTAAYYEERARRPREAISAKVFAAQLAERRRQERS